MRGCLITLCLILLIGGAIAVICLLAAHSPGMEVPFILAGSLFIGLVLLGVIAALMLTGRGRGGDGSPFGEKNGESRRIQDLYKGFEELNERIETLETILLDAARRQR